MTDNSGKKFEKQFKLSVPEYCLLQRLNDPPQSFTKSSFSKFSIKNPCDFLMFDSISHILYCLELKTTKYKSMSFEDIKSEGKQNKMIHKHQILSLLEFSKFENVTAGFILNFRDEKSGIERTYFQNITDFHTMYQKINKVSFNEIDLIMNGNAIKISGIKKRVNYQWDLEEFLKTTH